VITSASSPGHQPRGDPPSTDPGRIHAHVDDESETLRQEDGGEHIGSSVEPCRSMT
jgi:hypothetical protein